MLTLLSGWVLLALNANEYIRNWVSICTFEFQEKICTNIENLYNQCNILIRHHFSVLQNVSTFYIHPFVLSDMGLLLNTHFLTRTFVWWYTDCKQGCNELVGMCVYAPLGDERLCKAEYCTCILLPPANEVWGKVMFVHVSVILSMGGGGVEFPACITSHVTKIRGGLASQHASQVACPASKEGRGLIDCKMPNLEVSGWR